MAGPLDRGTIDYERLSGYLKVLAVANRLQLLHKLQVPHTAAEIDLKPSRQSRTLSDDRPLTRQAVVDHLKTLEEIGLVDNRPRARDPQQSAEYVVNQPRLFELVEELKRLSLIRPVGPAAPQRTTLAAGAAAMPEPPVVPDEPALLLVSGPLEGASFPLAGGGPWTIGRDPKAQVPLPYDPFVSSANTVVERRRLGYEVHALPGARNGTWRNWRRIEPGERETLKSGDVLGVGRSLLVFRKG